MPFNEYSYTRRKRDSKGRFVKGSHKKILLPAFFRYSFSLKNLHGAGNELDESSRFDAIITTIRISSRSEDYGTKNANKIKGKLKAMLHKHLDAELWNWNASNNQTIQAYEVEQIGKDELRGAQLYRAYSRIIIKGEEESLRSEVLY